MLSKFDAVPHDHQLMIISVSLSAQPAFDYASRQRQGLGNLADLV
jgi:hypothetical protein